MSFEPRPISIHERYALVQDNLGQPSLITYVAAFSPSSTKLPTRKACQSSLDGLVEEQAILQARIVGWDTVEPRWMPLIDGQGKRPCEVVWNKSLAGVNQTGPLDKQELGMAMQQLIKQETAQARQELNLETGDLYRVVRVATKAEDTGFIVLVVNHTIADGMGGLGFLSTLIQRTVGYADRSSVPLTLPPSLESTIQVKPALTTIIAAVWSQLIVPKLPIFLGNRLTDQKAAWIWPEWPVNSEKQDDADISTLPFEHSVVLLPVDLVQKLVAASAVHKTPDGTPRIKLTSMLVSALMQAIHSTMEDKVEVYLTGNVPLSERKPELGHPGLLGNLMVPGTFRWLFPAEDQRTEEERFWTIAEDLARRLEDDLRRGGRETWGLTAYIPNDQRTVTDSPALEHRRRGAFTGWEDYFGAPHKRSRYSSSFQFSNLGRLPTLFPKVDAIVWGHPAACFGAEAVEVDCISSSSGDVWMCVNWRDGKQVDGELIQRIVKEMKGLLGRLARDAC